MIVRLRAAGEEPRELERLETRVPTTIEPGESTLFRRELTTACTSRFNDISVVAFASRRGDTELPTPGREEEVDASRIQEAAAAPGDIPVLGAPVATGVGTP